MKRLSREAAEAMQQDADEALERQVGQETKETLT